MDEVSSRFGTASSAIDEALRKAIKTTGAVVDSETISALKTKAVSVYDSAIRIGRSLGDLNKDGKVDEEDLKIAAAKIGIAWDSVDPELKSALVAGAVASGLAFMIPFVGQALALPVFVGATAYFFLVGKLSAMKRK